MYLSATLCKTHALAPMREHFRALCQDSTFTIRMVNPLGEGKHTEIYDGVHVTVETPTGDILAAFEMNTVPNNCGMVLISYLYGSQEEAGLKWALWIGQRMGFSLAVYTTSRTQKKLKGLLEQYGFESHQRVKNRRSGNRVCLWSRTLPAGKSRKWREWGLVCPNN